MGYQKPREKFSVVTFFQFFHATMSTISIDGYPFKNMNIKCWRVYNLKLVPLNNQIYNQTVHTLTSSKCKTDILVKKEIRKRTSTYAWKICLENELKWSEVIISHCHKSNQQFYHSRRAHCVSWIDLLCQT
jgi:hypothetical protein